jgi:hypothetical protein
MHAQLHTIEVDATYVFIGGTLLEKTVRLQKKVPEEIILNLASVSVVR